VHQNHHNVLQCYIRCRMSCSITFAAECLAMLHLLSNVLQYHIRCRMSCNVTFAIECLAISHSLPNVLQYYIRRRMSCSIAFAAQCLLVSHSLPNVSTWCQYVYIQLPNLCIQFTSSISASHFAIIIDSTLYHPYFTMSHIVIVFLRPFEYSSQPLKKQIIVNDVRHYLATLGRRYSYATRAEIR
jgi:hypothetical protein